MDINQDQLFSIIEAIREVEAAIRETMTPVELAECVGEIQTPAPTPAGWTPKKGERVLVECKGTVIDVNPSIMPVSALIEFKHGNAEWFLTTHILPDPVKPKFSAGDEVFSTHVFRAAAVVRYELRSNPGYWVNNGLAASSEWWSEDSLISLAEAREKLAK